jgi:hypothetical protein
LENPRELGFFCFQGSWSWLRGTSGGPGVRFCGVAGQGRVSVRTQLGPPPGRPPADSSRPGVFCFSGRREALRRLIPKEGMGFNLLVGAGALHHSFAWSGIYSQAHALRDVTAICGIAGDPCHGKYPRELCPTPLRQLC